MSTYAAAAVFDQPWPADDLSARFIIPWTVAAGLLRGGLTDDVFAPRALKDDQLRSLARRVQVAADPELDRGYPDGRPATGPCTGPTAASLSRMSTGHAVTGQPRYRRGTCAAGRHKGWFHWSGPAPPTGCWLRWTGSTGTDRSRWLRRFGRQASGPPQQSTPGDVVGSGSS